jgi:GrpB-like predicted nucleotidyltransferase (UPF0157 family)
VGRDDELRRITVGEPARLDGPVLLVDHRPEWPALYAREEARIRRALGDRALLVEHVGSTSVPGLAAKPIVDVLLTVADSADEPAYLPALVAAGYSVRLREPDWFEHRMLKGPDTDINLHVFGDACPEVERMLRFRDRLRASDADRERYLAAKRALAGRRWRYVQDYADAKSGVIAEILAGA